MSKSSFLPSTEEIDDLCRAARYCHAGAHGGQIAVPLDLIRRVISNWCATDCPPLSTAPQYLTFLRGSAAESLVPFPELAYTDPQKNLSNSLRMRPQGEPSC